MLLDRTEHHKGLGVSVLNFIRNLLLSLVVTLASMVPNDSVYPMLGAMVSIALAVIFLSSQIIISVPSKRKSTSLS